MKTICAKCQTSTATRSKDGRYGKFLHSSCFNKWWRSEYEYMGGPYYQWMRQGMCKR